MTDNAAAAASSADMAKVEAAIDTAFADPAARTAGVVVVHKGRLIAERAESADGREGVDAFLAKRKAEFS